MIRVFLSVPLIFPEAFGRDISFPWAVIGRRFAFVLVLVRFGDALR
jgi:hypothetical protein